MKNWFKRDKAEERSFDEIVSEKTDEQKSEVEETKSTLIDDIKCSALDCFGMNEGKSEDMLIKCANVWYLIASFLWFLVGCLTFAPVIFLQSKVNVIFKDKKKSLICAILTHILVIAIIVVAIILRK